jgi:hypothetical protein
VPLKAEKTTIVKSVGLPLGRQEISHNERGTAKILVRTSIYGLDTATYMLWLSLRIVNEKQQGMPSSGEFELGFFRVQLVSIAFCVLSNAMAPNFSQ